MGSESVFFSSRRRHTRYWRDWSSDVCSSDLLEAGCHVLMHEVGRRYAKAHRLTLGSLQHYIPRSNDPNCSAGFGMGLVMYLGPQILVTSGRSALTQCMRLATRYRSYTCV